MLVRLQYVAAAYILLAVVVLLATLCAAPPQPVVYSSDIVNVERLSDNTYRLTFSVEVAPWSKLHIERLFCVVANTHTDVNITVFRLEPEGARLLVNGRTIGAHAYVSVAPNSSLCVELVYYSKQPYPTTVKGEVLVVLTYESPNLGIVAAAATVTSLGIAVTLATERGREKLFKVLSVPAFYFLYREQDVLQNDKRRKIMNFLEKNPGVSLRRLAREVGISIGELQWHISVLERAGLVEYARIGKWTVYYPRFCPIDKWLYNFLVRETRVKVTRDMLVRSKGEIERMLAKTNRIALSDLKKALVTATARPLLH